MLDHLKMSAKIMVKNKSIGFQINLKFQITISNAQESSYCIHGLGNKNENGSDKIMEQFQINKLKMYKKKELLYLKKLNHCRLINWKAGNS